MVAAILKKHVWKERRSITYVSSVGVLRHRAGILITAIRNQNPSLHLFFNQDQPPIGAVRLLVAEELDADALAVAALQQY